ncbi:hypothetical protein QJS10_CPB04g01664 [Acorus calamus]|uniref:Uncharacterized protein n=1 Tax=Acorus calamus TaxID=4465 RepID=A0AAV9EYX8_ACOCL|nr:hypothetical protein QJS10_CPB04g01664 [Acorus calamus]
MEISYERERINKLRQEAETENQAIVKLQYELEVERKALSMASSKAAGFRCCYPGYWTSSRAPECGGFEGE